MGCDKMSHPKELSKGCWQSNFKAGVFFWKNKGFEQHARDIGLAEMPQVGVIPNVH